MYKLTIDAATVSVTDHRDRDGAESELLRQARAGDYYLRPVRADSASTTYQLLQLPDIDNTATPSNRRPRRAGHAIIEKLPTKPAGAMPHQAAVAVCRWLDQNWGHHDTEADGSVREVPPVLAAARDEAHGLIPARATLGDAAHLAGVAPVTLPDRELLQALRRKAIAGAGTTVQPEDLAGTVAHLLPAATPTAQTTAVIWWYALLTRGAAP